MDHLSEFPFLLSQVLFIHFINGNHVMQDSCFTAFALLLKTLDIIGYCRKKIAGCPLIHPALFSDRACPQGISSALLVAIHL